MYHDQTVGPYDPRAGVDPIPEAMPLPEPGQDRVLALTYAGPISTAGPWGTQGPRALWPTWIYQTYPARDSWGHRIEALVRLNGDVRDIAHGYDRILVPVFRNNGHSYMITAHSRQVGRDRPVWNRVSDPNDRETRVRRMEGRAREAMMPDLVQLRVINDTEQVESMYDDPFIFVSMDYRTLCADQAGIVWFGRRRYYDWGEITRLESWDGYDADGWSRDGYDREGYNRSGYNRAGWDREGYNREGWSRYGNHRDGRHREDCQCIECAVQGYHRTERDWKLPEGWQDRILFGLENELDTEDFDAQRRAVKLLPKRGKADWFLIAERDSSLGEYGIEFVGPPLPIEYYLSGREEAKINPWFDYLPKIVDQCGADAPEHDHGMHINVSREPLVRWDQDRGQRWERRFLDTINSCRKLVEFVAGRRANEWADFKARGPARYGVTGEGGQKYRVANVQKRVIELRIFRASTNPERMRANVQFAYACLMWTKRGYKARGNRCDARLIAWIKDHPTKYPDLIKLLESYTPTGLREEVPSPPSDYRADWDEANACPPADGCGACERQREIRRIYLHLTNPSAQAQTLETAQCAS